jgi:DNA (cytosine-5)-methyltransferase 1/site-specific DNA-methyltransferase (adenine-specific)
MENITLIHADSYNYIHVLKEKNIFVNHIITDPPYNISKENNFNTLNNRNGIDFGEWDKNFDLFGWIKEYEQILDKNGSMIIFCSYLYISFIIQALEQANMVTKDIIVWQKSNPMPRNVNRRYVQDMEFAIWAVKKNAKWTFHKEDDIPYLRGFFKYPIVSGKDRIHPTQKNVNLIEDLIKIHTNEQDIIIDPFMGSGSTGIACNNLNRKFIGIEKDEKNFNNTINLYTKNNIAFTKK